MSGAVNGKYDGWAPKIVRVDLTRGKILKETLTTDLALNFLGGRGINSKILYDEVKPGIDAYDPENRLIFGVGPLNGTLSPASGRFTVSAKSPLTGALGDANCGGEFAAELKYAGYGTIVFSGKSKNPVYLWIDDKSIELRDAKHLWGMNTWDTERRIQEELDDPDIQVACIGPAGENQVRFACIIHQLGRAAGRTGMGGVMGSKHLKAVAVRGTGGVKIAHPERLQNVVYESFITLSTDVFYRLYSDYGTPGLMTLYNEYGGNASYNSKQAWVDWIDQVSGEAFIENYSVKSQACYSCPLHCDKYYLVPSGLYASYGNSMEYENMTAFGTRCGNKNLASIIKASTLADQFGLDTISTGAVIAWAMECYEKGILTSDDLEGLDLAWGNSDAILELIKMIGYKKGAGKILAEGSQKASKILGKGSDKFLACIKGMEVPAVDPRAFSGYGALGYSVASRGGDHLRALAASSYMMDPETAEKLFGSKKAADRFAAEGQGRLVAFHEDMRAVTDSAEICKYITRTALLFPEPVAEIITAVTGWEVKPKALRGIGERIVNLERIFNIREGFTRKDDRPTYRLMYEPIPSGPAKGHFVAEWLDTMLDEFYETRGWEKTTGIPTSGTLRRLGLTYASKDLKMVKKATKKGGIING